MPIGRGWRRGTSAEALAGVDLVLMAPGQGYEGLPRVPVAVMGSVLSGAGLTVPEGKGGLAELAIGEGATSEQMGGGGAPLVALGRRLGWRVVAAGPGGPIELGLRLAQDEAEQQLLLTHPPEVVAAALAAFGMGQAWSTKVPPMPRGGRALIQTCLAALAAEGARMLEDGRARRPSDVDTVALLSGLIPRWHGGPLFQADQRGLLVLRADLRKLGGAGIFAVPQVLDDLIAEGQRFADLEAP